VRQAAHRRAPTQYVRADAARENAEFGANAAGEAHGVFTVRCMKRVQQEKSARGGRIFSQDQAGKTARSY